LPSVLQESLKIVEFGGQGITVHPRPDGRHILWPDVIELKEHIKVELNIEGYPSTHFLEKVLQIIPAQCTLVPDPPEVLTSNAGWRLQGNEDILKVSIRRLKDKGIRVSLFVDPNVITMQELIALRDMGADRVEMYTESYADAFAEGRHQEEIKAYQNCAQVSASLGLKVNAGHDLNLDNLAFFAEKIPELAEVSIGHALVCDALNFGWKRTIEKYLDCLE
jgi:pyridoxine 5-phosphate synthase